MGQKRFDDSNPDEEIEKIIQEIVNKHNGNYGYRRIDMELRKRGYIVNHKT
ncbi:transposase [Bacillus ginsengihumi]|uniref:Transposase n=1 Tax=Heyndrickxia ginsengihumi TaxID=363870 RepID=A0A6M0P4Z0_9BACI|nr:transposase [Heyndrickxia ginsengihumi]